MYMYMYMYVLSMDVDKSFARGENCNR
jgi:hypothetical protein